MNLLLSLCLVLCLTASSALPQNVGTGQNCVKAQDTAGGPQCKASQVGVCCDPTKTSDNCQTTLYGLSASKKGQMYCADLAGSYSGDPQHPFATLVPFCCDQMNVPGASCLGANEPVGSFGDFDTFCCASNTTTGGVNCVNTYHSAPCPAADYPGRPLFCD